MPVRDGAPEPLLVMAAAAVAVIGDHVDMLVAVIGQRDLERRLAAIPVRFLLLIVAAIFAPGVGDRTDGLLVVLSCSRRRKPRA